MNVLPSNPILEFNPNQMMDVRKLFGYDDLNRLQQDVQILDDWIKKQQHFLVKDYDAAYLERHLINSKGSVERAKKHIDKLCTLRGLMPDYLQGYDIKNEFNDILNIFHMFVFPKPTPDNYRLMYMNIHNPDATLFEHKSLARYVLLIVEYLHRHDYNVGIEVICDTTKISLGMISKINPIIMANAFMIITEAVGLRVKGLHFISGSKFFDTVLAIVKRGLSKKLTSRLHIHENYESIIKFIPKSILSQDIGGDFPTTSKDINENNFKAFSTPEFINTMKFVESAATDESKRLSTKFNEDYSGVPGSFKVLTVD